MSRLPMSASSVWRRAASVVLAAGWRHPDPSAPSPFEGFRLLLVQRATGRGIMPGAHVFPGGVVHAADSSADWLPLFAPHHGPPRFGLASPKLRQSAVKVLLPAGPDSAVEDGAALPDDVALRICAIRETFEEAGVLLLRPRDSPATEPEPGCAFPLSADLAAWRALVHSDPHHFLRLCAHLDCTPDIWALHDWHTWFTPFRRRGDRRRFETAFFLCCLSEPPPVYPDMVEVVSCQWSSLSEAIGRFIKKEIWLPPPQFYEIRRLENFASLSDLHKFCLDRVLEGMERWMAIILVTADGEIQLLPGDELYIEDPNLVENDLSTEKKVEEIMKEGKKFHRIVINGRHTYSIYVTVQSQYKHIYPKTYVANKSHL